MTRKSCFATACAALAILALPTVQADSHGYLEEAQASLKTLQEKFTGLAEAMPQDKYAYRPAEGVRSVSEVLLHISGANYFVEIGRAHV